RIRAGSQPQPRPAVSGNSIRGAVVSVHPCRNTAVGDAIRKGTTAPERQSPLGCADSDRSALRCPESVICCHPVAHLRRACSRRFRWARRWVCLIAKFSAVALAIVALALMVSCGVSRPSDRISKTAMALGIGLTIDGPYARGQAVVVPVSRPLDSRCGCLLRN